MTQQWKPSGGGFSVEPLENIDSQSDLPDVTALSESEIRAVRTGELAPDYIAPWDWDSQAEQYQYWRSVVDGFRFDIPDSVVERPNDNGTTSSDKRGIRFTSDVVWEDEIGGRVSSNTDGATRAYIYRVDGAELIGDADISDLSGGDAFTVDLSDPIGDDDEEYNFVLDAEGLSFDLGWYDSSDPPETSDDGNMSIIAAADGETGTTGNYHGIEAVGNIGFD